MSDLDISYFRQKLARDISRMFRAIERKGSFNAREIQEILRMTRKMRKQLELLQDAVIIYGTVRAPDDPGYKIQEPLYNPTRQLEDIYFPVK